MIPAVSAVRIRSLRALLVVSSMLMAGKPLAGAQSSDASLCRLLPIEHIERVLGAKAGKPTGADIIPGIGNCSVTVPDPKHMVILSTAPLAGETGGGIVERTKRGLKLMESSRAPKPKTEYQYFGDVVCAAAALTPPMKQTTCMMDKGMRQFNFAIRSDNPSHLRVEDVRQLLQETVAKAK